MRDINQFLNERHSKEEIKAFKEEIADYLKENFIPSETPKNDQFVAWFDGYLKNYIFKNGINLNEDEQFKEDLLHKIDYLNSAQAKKRFDRMTWDVLEGQVEQWEQFLKRRAENGDDPTGTLLTCQLSNQWSAVELRTDKALSYEGGVMGHCVGSYASKVREGRSSVYSIRDKKEQSHITVEYSNVKNLIVQVQGKQNQLPPEKYLPSLFEFAREKSLSFDVSLFKKLGIKQLGYEFIPQGEDYQNRLKEVINDPELCQNGGVLDLRGEKCNDTSITGKWDVIYIDSKTRLNDLSDVNADTIVVEGYSNELVLNNVDVNKLEISNALFKDLSKTTVNEKLKLENTWVQAIPNYSLESLEYRCDSQMSVLECCDAACRNLTIENAPKLKTIADGKYGELDLTNTAVNDLTNITADKINVTDSPVVKMECSNFGSGYFRNIDIEKLSGINDVQKGSFTFEKCPNLETVSDIKSPSLNLKINFNPQLKKVSNVSTGGLDLRGNDNLESLEKIRVHRANFEDINFDKIKTRRLNVRKINTSDKELLKTRKIGATQRFN